MNILDNGVEVQNGQFQYLWYRLVDDLGQHRYRAVALRELTSLALDDREIEDYNAWGKQWGAVQGLYNAGVDFVYAASGIFTPDHVGVVQFYGAAADGVDLADASRVALRNLSAVDAVLANQQQSKTRPPLLRWMEWYLDFVTNRAKNVVAILGHPDPRDGRKGIRLMDGGIVDDGGDPSSEQNEMLFRGLAKLREDFVFQVTADHIGHAALRNALFRVAQEASKVASRQRGAISIGASLSIPLMAALNNSLSGGHSLGETQSHSLTAGQNHSWGEGSQESWSHTDSFAHTRGTSKSEGLAVSHTDGRSVTISEADTVGQADTVSHAVTEGEAWTRSRGVTHSQSTMSGWSSGGSTTNTHSESQNASQSATVGASTGTTISGGVNAGGQANVGIPGTMGAGANAGVSAGMSVSGGESASVSNGVGSGIADSVSTTSSWGVSGGSSSGTAVTSGSAYTRSHSETDGVAHTDSQAHTDGNAVSTMEADSVTRSWQWGENESFTSGYADSVGGSQSRQEGWGETQQEGITDGWNMGRNTMTGITRGLSTGLMPGINIGRSWQTEDDVAIRLTEILRSVEGQLNIAASEGGFLAEAILLTATDNGAVASEALAPQAFRGPKSPTPVLTVSPQGPDADLLRAQALAFTPSRKAAPNDFLGGALGGQYSTILTAQQIAAYTAPAIFREGTVRVVPAIPKDSLGFYPDMPGEVLMGHQFSPETGDLTHAPVMLAKNRFVHMLFAGATGYGKSVGAVRLAFEMSRKWNMRLVVLDFGAGWRQLLNAPGIEHKVDIRQLTPYGVRPLRWNPLQISRYIIPEIQLAAFVDIFGNVAQLGVKQQKHRFYDAVEEIYLQKGILVNDPKILADPVWGKVSGRAEAAACGYPAGTSIRSLSLHERQEVAVLRSQTVSLQDLFKEIEKRRDAMPARDQIGRGVLDGILERLKSLLRGATAAQFDAGPDATDVAELGMGEKSLLILEGGKHLDQFSKAWLLSWAGWIIYTDMMQQKERQLITGDAELVMFFEEANIIFTGLGAQDENNKGGATVAEQYDNMFRDSRKYGVRFVVITQSPALIPAGVRASCSSVFLGYLTEPDDKDVALAAIARSEKGFHDEPWRRFISDQGIGMNLGRLPYTFERTEMRPFLFRPLMLNAKEPSDAEIAEVLGSIAL